MNKVGKSIKTQKVQALVEHAWYLDRVRIHSTYHAAKRGTERAIDTLDLRAVILYGFHEATADIWHEKRRHWTYDLRNKNVDGRDIRIIFDIEGYPDVVVVTVMHVYP